MVVERRLTVCAYNGEKSTHLSILCSGLLYQIFRMHMKVFCPQNLTIFILSYQMIMTVETTEKFMANIDKKQIEIFLTRTGQCLQGDLCPLLV